jgi:hypothetical protein
VNEGVRPFKGSVMVVNDRNHQGFLDKIQSDVYIRDGVWNIHEAQMMYFRTLLRWQRVADGEY